MKTSSGRLAGSRRTTILVLSAFLRCRLAFFLALSFFFFFALAAAALSRSFCLSLGVLGVTTEEGEGDGAGGDVGKVSGDAGGMWVGEEELKRSERDNINQPPFRRHSQPMLRITQ